MKKFRTERDPYTGAIEHYYWDDMEKKMHVKREFDASRVLELNKRQQANAIDQRYGNQMAHHEARIPNEIVYKWRKEYGVNVFSKDPWHQKKVKQLLNDPEWRYLRSSNHKL